MKNKLLRRNFWVRFAAFFLLIIINLSLVAGVIATTYGAQFGYFIDNGETDREDMRQNFGYRYALRIINEYFETNDNVLYHYSGNYYFYNNKYYVNSENVDYFMRRADGDTIIYSSKTSERYTQSEEYEIEVTYCEVSDPEKEIAERFIVTVNYPLISPYQDGYTLALKLSQFLSNFKYVIVALSLILLIFSVAFFIYLMQSSGLSSDGQATPGFLGKVPIELFACIIAAIETCVCGLTTLIVDGFNTEVPGIIFFAILTFVLFTWLCMSLASRFRSKTFFKYCLTCLLLKAVGKFFRFIWRIYHKAGFLWRSAVILVSVSIALLICTVITYAEEPAGLVLMYLLWATLCILFSFACANLAKLRKAISRLAQGDYTTKVSTFGMFFDFRRAAHNINSTFDGMTQVVEERMKSERMKTELITNVSHDIKTPLTSIINCVDIMKNSGEDFSDQTKEYLEILSRQSLRLKKLTEDILEASKASTGNIAVELGPVDMGTLVSQALGEYEDKLEESNIKTIVSIDKENIVAMADGRLLWRVFDNIFSNIRRYSLPGTRAYIDVFKANGIVYATFKNVSAYELPADPSELLERFVRGDTSRNTEGSGLGLTISENLCSLMGGKLTIATEADLFKITVALPSYAMPNSATESDIK